MSERYLPIVDPASDPADAAQIAERRAPASKPGSKWRWNEDRHSFIDSEGHALSHADLVALRDGLVEGYSELSGSLVDSFYAGTTSLTEFQTAFQTLIDESFRSQYLLGRGGANAAGSEAFDTLSKMISDQMPYARNFVDDLAAQNLSNAEAANRAAQYHGSAVEAFERGKAESYGGIDLPFFPADGGTQCVKSPYSRVITARGLVPISNVVVGDLVMTHRHRFRPVTRVIRSFSKSKTFAEIAVNGSSPVTFTRDHRLFTPYGWSPLDGIMQGSMLVHSIRGESDENGSLRRLRESMRQPFESVSILCESDQGDRAMGQSRDPQADVGFGQERFRVAANQLRRFDVGIELAEETRRSLLPPILGRGSAKNRVPLPMGVDQSEWTDSSGRSHSPQERRQRRRPAGELGVHHSGQACSLAHDQSEGPRDGDRTGRYPARWSEGDLRDVWQRVSNSGEESGQPLLFATLLYRVAANETNLPDVWEDVYRMPTARSTSEVLQPGLLLEEESGAQQTNMPYVQGIVRWWTASWERPEVLQSGMLPDGTILYDLSVADDHSFVVEGIAAHNCGPGCRCAWVLTETDTRYEAYWETNQDGAVCVDCEARGNLYSFDNPLTKDK